MVAQKLNEMDFQMTLPSDPLSKSDIQIMHFSIFLVDNLFCLFLSNFSIDTSSICFEKKKPFCWTLFQKICNNLDGWIRLKMLRIHLVGIFSIDPIVMSFEHSPLVMFRLYGTQLFSNPIIHCVHCAVCTHFDSSGSDSIVNISNVQSSRFFVWQIQAIQ